MIGVHLCLLRVGDFPKSDRRSTSSLQTLRLPTCSMTRASSKHIRHFHSELLGFIAQGTLLSAHKRPRILSNLLLHVGVSHSFTFAPSELLGFVAQDTFQDFKRFAYLLASRQELYRNMSATFIQDFKRFAMADAADPEEALITSIKRINKRRLVRYYLSSWGLGDYLMIF